MILLKFSPGEREKGDARKRRRIRVPIKRDARKTLPTLGNKSISMNFPRNSRFRRARLKTRRRTDY